LTTEQVAKRIGKPVTEALDILMQLAREGLGELGEDGRGRLSGEGEERHGHALTDLRLG
jgi:hypothetical protein